MFINDLTLHMLYRLPILPVNFCMDAGLHEIPDYMKNKEYM